METLYKGNKMSNKDISDKHKRDVERTRTMNELRQVKTFGYRQKHPTRAKNMKRELNHHDIIYSNSDIQTPVEWLSANSISGIDQTVPRCMEGYAAYYVDKLIELKLI